MSCVIPEQQFTVRVYGTLLKLATFRGTSYVTSCNVGVRLRKYIAEIDKSYEASKRNPIHHKKKVMTKEGEGWLEKQDILRSCLNSRIHRNKLAAVREVISHILGANSPDVNRCGLLNNP